VASKVTPEPFFAAKLERLAKASGHER
jgi:hypothetical protein